MCFWKTFITGKKVVKKRFVFCDLVLRYKIRRGCRVTSVLPVYILDYRWYDKWYPSLYKYFKIQIWRHLLSLKANTYAHFPPVPLPTHTPACINQHYTSNQTLMENTFETIQLVDTRKNGGGQYLQVKGDVPMVRLHLCLHVVSPSEIFISIDIFF